jgi:hypothetical protein
MPAYRDTLLDDTCRGIVRRLEEIDEAKRQGRIDPEEAARLEAEITRAMVRPRPPEAVTREPEESER